MGFKSPVFSLIIIGPSLLDHRKVTNKWGI